MQDDIKSIRNQLDGLIPLDSNQLTDTKSKLDEFNKLLNDKTKILNQLTTDLEKIKQIKWYHLD